MAELHNGVLNKLYGKIDSDEEFTAIIKHINKLTSEGFPVNWYRDNHNRVRVKHGHTWYLYKDLSKHIPNLRFECEEKKEYVLEKQWYKKQRSNSAGNFTWEFIYKWV